MSYLKDYTEQMRLAMVEDHIDVRGYFGWRYVHVNPKIYMQR